MAGKRYSAGAIFLQVVPVFSDVQNIISDEADKYGKVLGDQMEKSGAVAGKRAGNAMAKEMAKTADEGGKQAAEKYAGHFESKIKSAVKSAQRELDAINLESLDNVSEKALRDFKRIENQLKNISNQDFSVDFDARKILADLELLEGMIRGLTKVDHKMKLNVFSNLRDVEKDLAKVRTLAEAVAKEQHEIKFGAKADFKQIEREMGSFEKKFKATIKRSMDALGDSVDHRVRQVKGELQDLLDTDINLDMDASSVMAQAAAVQTYLETVLKDKTIGINVKHDILESLKALRGFGDEIDKIEPKVERAAGAFETAFKKATDRATGAIASSSDRTLRRIKDDLTALGNLPLSDPKIDTGKAFQELKDLERELWDLAHTSPDIDVRVDAAKAYAEITGVTAAVDKLDGKTARVDVDTRGAQKATSVFAALGLAGDRGANAFRSFNIILLATTTIGPALIPVLAGIAGGLIALGPAAAIGAAGLGSVLIGFSGLSDALTALGNQQDQAAMTAQSSANTQRAGAQAIADAEDALADARQNAARAAEDAAERVADAREAAAEAIKDALEAQKEAQEDYRDSVKDVAEAERALREARQEARGTGAELDRDITENQLAIDQAILDAFNTTVEYNALQEDGSATNAEQEQARINMEEAQLLLERLRQEQKDLAKEKKKWDKDGVNGTDDVKDAQEALNEALEAQREAYERMQEAAEAADEARVEGAEAVQEALEAQRETAQDNARAIADAQEALRRANQGYSESLGAVNAQQNAVQTAMDKLGPAGEKFARFLFSLRKGFYAFRDDIQQVMLPAVQQAIQGFLGSQNASVARDALIGLARAFGRFAKALSVSLQGESWGRFFAMLAEFGPSISKAYGDAFITFMEAMAELMVLAAPFALDFAEALSDLMASFRDWSKSEGAASAMQDFFDYLRGIGPELTEFVESLGGAFVALVIALAPLGESVLTALTGFFNAIANMDPDQLQFLATAVVGMVGLFQVISGLASLVVGLGAVFTPFGAIVVGIAALVAGFVYLWNTNEGFREFMKEAWNEISAVVGDAWEKTLKPALEDLGEAFEELWVDILEPFFAWLGPIILDFVKFYLPRLMATWAAVATGIAWAIEHILIPAIEMLVDFAQWMWFKVLKPIIGYFRENWNALSIAVRWAWRNILKPAWEALSSTLRWLWRYVIKPIFNWIGEHWDDILASMKEAWNKVLRPAWNDLIAAAKWLWNRVLKPIFGFIGEVWEETLRAMDKAWDKVLKPVFDFIVEKALPKLKKGFNTTVEAIKTIWDGLKKVVGEPIKFMIGTVLNGGLIAGFNKVAKFVGRDGIDPIEMPQALQNLHTGGVFGRRRNYDSGGVMPGYTPGQDVHHFVSPTGGRLNLSGGEAVMRPEFTAAVGTGFVDQMNAIARAQGVAGIRRAMGYEQSFAKGGKIVFPVPGGYVERTPYNLSHDGMDINHADDASGRVSFFSATSGHVTTTGYSRGYGNAVFIQSPYGELVYGHSVDGSIAVNPGQVVRAGTYLAKIGNTGNSDGAHLHFGFPDGTFYQAEALLKGASSPNEIKGAGNRNPLARFPGWIIDIAKNPLGYVKGLITKPVDAFREKFGSDAFANMISDVPFKLVKSVKDKMVDFLPGPLEALANKAGAGGHGGEGVPSAPTAAEAMAFANGGVLPYNGTMKYDSGGYLPPGLTSVVNLTGKPEPVFTADQFDGMGGEGSGTIHYEPHFEGSNLTPEDVASDLNFTYRRLRRSGKYGANK